MSKRNAAKVALTMVILIGSVLLALRIATGGF